MVFLNVTAISNSLLAKPITALDLGFTCHFQVLRGGGVLDEILIKTDQHGNDQKPTGRLRIYALKIILFVLDCRKKKTRSIRKEKRSIN